MGAVLTMTPRAAGTVEASKRNQVAIDSISRPGQRGKVLAIHGQQNCPRCGHAGVCESHGRYSKSGRYEYVSAWCLRCDTDFVRVYEVADADARARRGGVVR